MSLKEIPLIVQIINFTTESLTFEKKALNWPSFHLRRKTSLLKSKDFALEELNYEIINLVLCCSVIGDKFWTHINLQL